MSANLFSECYEWDNDTDRTIILLIGQCYQRDNVTNGKMLLTGQYYCRDNVTEAKMLPME